MNDATAQALQNAKLYDGLPEAPPGGDLQARLLSKQLRSLETVLQRLGNTM